MARYNREDIQIWEEDNQWEIEALNKKLLKDSKIQKATKKSEKWLEYQELPDK